MLLTYYWRWKKNANKSPAGKISVSLKFISVLSGFSLTEILHWLRQEWRGKKGAGAKKRGRAEMRDRGEGWRQRWGAEKGQRETAEPEEMARDRGKGQRRGRDKNETYSRWFNTQSHGHTSIPLTMETHRGDLTAEKHVTLKTSSKGQNESQELNPTHTYTHMIIGRCLAHGDGKKWADRKAKW